jgi:hypothetical protein
VGLEVLYHGSRDATRTGVLGVHLDRGRLPGNWESSRFNEAVPVIRGRKTAAVMHNDAVVQGLSEAPFMREVSRWGIVTIGTGLGNALFKNRL